MAAVTEPLSAETSARLLDLARTCKAAVKAVAMYPPTHPAIQDALARITAAGAGAVAGGPFQFTVTPDTLLVEGRGLQRPDAPTSELAAMLHAHDVGEVTLMAPVTPAGWHSFLLLLSQAAIDVRNDGGIRRAWEGAGGGPIVIRQIDYGEVLRERTEGDRADWNTILLGYLDGELTNIDDSVLAELTAIAMDPERLGVFVEGIAERAATRGWQATQRAQLSQLLQALAARVASTDPDHIDHLLRNVAGALPKMTPEVVTGLLDASRPVDAKGEPTGLDLGGELRARLEDDTIARFVANRIAQDRTASGRLAEAFHALVPEDARRSRVVELARGPAAHGPLGADPTFDSLWQRASDLLLSYSDEQYVSADYAGELSAARAEAADIDRISDDPPDRVAAWVASVSHEHVRQLDQQVLGDLLVLEQRPDEWRKVHALALGRIDELVLARDLAPAQELVDALLGLSRDAGCAFASDVRAGLVQLASGNVMTHILLIIRQAEDADLPRVTRLCLSLGRPVVGRLIDALMVEENARTIRRLREVLMSFGGAARARVSELCGSKAPAVRRTAVELLRLLGGDALTHLLALLDDEEVQVQRDALRAMLHLGSVEAHLALRDALSNGPQRRRDAVLALVTAMRDRRTAPLLAFFVRQGQDDGHHERSYVSAIDTLGHLGVSTQDTVTALSEVLSRGHWWAPTRTRRLRSAAAQALRHLDSPEATAVLAAAAESGNWGVSRAARGALSASAPPPSTGNGVATPPASSNGTHRE